MINANPAARTIELARAAGFDLCGIAPAAEFPELAHLEDWLDRGHAGEMRYLQDERRRSPAQAMQGARSVIVCALNYNTAMPASTEAPAPASEQAGPRGWISRYAWGEDYHYVLGEKLEALLDVVVEDAEFATGEVCDEAAGTVFYGYGKENVGYGEFQCGLAVGGILRIRGSLGVLGFGRSLGRRVRCHFGDGSGRGILRWKNRRPGEKGGGKQSGFKRSNDYFPWTFHGLPARLLNVRGARCSYGVCDASLQKRYRILVSSGFAGTNPETVFQRRVCKYNPTTQWMRK